MSPVDECREYTALGQPFRAFKLIDAERERRLASSAPIDAEFEATWREARRMYLLDRARRYIFLEYELEARRDLAALETIDPDNPEIPVLRRRATEKLARRAVEQGHVYLRRRMLSEAMAKFLEAESILPTLGAAVEGQHLVAESVDALTVRAQQQFLEAVRKLPQFRYAEVRWHSSNAIVNDPDRADAEKLQRRAQHELALERKTAGDTAARAGNFGAALMEYKAAKAREDELSGIDDLIAKMERELAADKLADTAQMRMRQQRFDEARAALDEAFGMSIMLRGEISELMIENRHLEGMRDYNKARDLEIQGKKQEAAEAFAALAAKWPDGLEDEKVRAELLQSDIDSAKAEWQAAMKAEAAGELEQALEHYQAADRFYARMADAKAKIAELERKIAAAKRPVEGSNEGQGGGGSGSGK